MHGLIGMFGGAFLGSLLFNALIDTSKGLAVIGFCVPFILGTFFGFGITSQNGNVSKGIEAGLELLKAWGIFWIFAGAAGLILFILSFAR